MKKWTGLAAVLSLGVLALAGDWQDKPFTDWSQDEVRSVLSRSPWVQVQRIGRPDLRAGIGRNDSRLPEGSSVGDRPTQQPSSPSTLERPQVQHFYSIKVMSQPVRMAMARWAMLHNGLTEEGARQFVDADLFQNHIVIGVSVPPGQDASELEQDSDVLQDSTFLHVKGSDSKLLLTRYLPPSQTGQTDGMFLFPRFHQDGQPTVTPGDKEIRFECGLNRDTKLSQKFKLKKMVFRDELAL